MTTPETPPDPAAQRPVMFDQAIIATLRMAVHQVFVKHADTVRTIGVFIDYHDPLNNTDLLKGLWVGADGTVNAPDSIMGSAAACHQLQEAILLRGDKLRVHLQERLQILLTEIRNTEEARREQEKPIQGQ